jgi:hypothetical protein
LSYCTIESYESEEEEEEGAFIQWFRHNQIVTKVDYCDMESNILCALSGNNYVQRLSFAERDRKLGEENIRALTQALATNQGIKKPAGSFFAHCRRTLISSSCPSGPIIERIWPIQQRAL